MQQKINEMLRVCTIVFVFKKKKSFCSQYYYYQFALVQQKILEVCTIIWFTLIVQSKIINTIFHY